MSVKDKFLVHSYKFIIKCNKTLVDEKDRCHYFYITKDVNEDITAFDYANFDEHLYAILDEHSILRCSLDSNSEPCRYIYNSVPDVKAMKAAFGAIWLYDDDNQLWKCFYANDKIDCKLFHQLKMSLRYASIVASSKNLYILHSDHEHKVRLVDRCDPNVAGSPCKRVFIEDGSMQKFVFLNN